MGLLEPLPSLWVVNVGLGRRKGEWAKRRTGDWAIKRRADSLSPVRRFAHSPFRLPGVARLKNIIISLSMVPSAGLVLDSIEWYNLHAESVVERHESIRATDANAWLRKDLPR